MFLRSSDFRILTRPPLCRILAGFRLTHQIQPVEAVLRPDDRPVRVVIPDGGGDTELLGQLHEQLDVLTTVQVLGELLFYRGVEDYVVEIRPLLIGHLVELVDEAILLLESISLEFAKLVDAATDRFVLDALDECVCESSVSMHAVTILM